jgi:hypothetical protein
MTIQAKRRRKKRKKDMEATRTRNKKNPEIFTTYKRKPKRQRNN